MTGHADNVCTHPRPVLATDQVIHGEALTIMRELPDATFDALITDPPYCMAVSRPGIAPAAQRCRSTPTAAR